MNYPLNMTNGIGYAVANTAAEYLALCEAGYSTPEGAVAAELPAVADAVAAPEAPIEPAPKRRGRPPKVPT